MDKVLFITIATGKYYDSYIPQLYKSMVNHVALDFDFLCFSAPFCCISIFYCYVRHYNITIYFYKRDARPKRYSTKEIFDQRTFCKIVE